MMKTIRLTGQVDHQHRLVAQVPDVVAPGSVEIELLVPSPSDDDSSQDWMRAIAREWADDLSDERQDIYSLTDGEPVDDGR